MPFPTTPQLDNFTRANASTLGVNYVTDGTGGSFGISGNQCNIPSLSLGYVYDAWSTTFSSDCEAWATIATVTTNGYYYLMMRTAGTTTTNQSGYAVIYNRPLGKLFLENINSANDGTSFISVTQTITAGDSFGGSCLKNVFTVWYKSGNATANYVALATATNGTYSTGGYIAMLAYDSAGGTGANALLVSSFGGGTYTNPASRTLTGAGV